MDTRKILLINLSRGKIGEDNAALLGSMMITKVQLAAMSRADISRERDRVDFFLYVDEFQNFATESFAVILSEARKYRLNLTMANQYISQIDEPIRNAVFGNVGTMITFRVGAQDTDALAKEFAPVFDANDLINLAKFTIYIKLMIDGISSPAFSAVTLPLDEIDTGNLEKIRAANRAQYTQPRQEVEDAIMQWAMSGVGEPTAQELALQSLQTILQDGSPAIAGSAKPIEPAGKTPGVKEVSTPGVEEAGGTQSAFNPADLVVKQSDTEKGIGKAVIGNRIYRELSAKGGEKWFFGSVLSSEEKEKLAEKLTKRRRPKPSPAGSATDGGEGAATSPAIGHPVATIGPGQSVKLTDQTERQPEDK